MPTTAERWGTLTSAPPVTLNDKLKMLRREIGLRKSVYPRRVAEGKMTQREMDHEIRVAEAILSDYEAQAAHSTQQALAL